jgi:peptidoglycan DL-endopeptidase CwlO
VIQSEVEALSRAHQMFVGSSRHLALDAGTGHYRGLLQRASGLNSGAGRGRYQLTAHNSREALVSAARTDAAAEAVIASAQRDRAQARELTKSVLDEARADTVVTPPTPMAQREAMRRRVARLRAQRAHVLLARRRTRRHLLALRALRYRMLHHHGSDLTRLRLPSADGRAGIAVRAAVATRPSLRLGRNRPRPV